jgi:hypothetical protein
MHDLCGDFTNMESAGIALPTALRGGCSFDFLILRAVGSGVYFGRTPLSLKEVLVVQA